MVRNNILSVTVVEDKMDYTQFSTHFLLLLLNAFNNSESEEFNKFLRSKVFRV